MDPGDLLNPGKVWAAALLAAFMGWPEAFEPIIGALATRPQSPIGERPDAAAGAGIPDDVAWYA